MCQLHLLLHNYKDHAFSSNSDLEVFALADLVDEDSFE